MSFEKYIDVVSGNFRRAIKVEWLNPDETVNFEFTNSLYDISVDLSVNYQNGSRRTCTLTLNNDRNKFPVNFNNLWIGQKFKLWMGVYIDEKTPYYFPQGVFYVSNPNEIYQPNTKTIKINGVDKWAYLDGTLHGKLSGIYQTSINTDLRMATRELLKLPTYSQTTKVSPDNIDKYFGVENGSKYYFQYGEITLSDGKKTKAYAANNRSSIYGTDVHGKSATTTLTAKASMTISFNYTYNSDTLDEFTLKVGDTYIVNKKYGTGSGTYSGTISEGETISFTYSKDKQGGEASNEMCAFYNLTVTTSNDAVDPMQPMISPYFETKKTTVDGKDVEVWKCPYTAKVERGKTYADVLLEYATILCAHVYYDANGRLVMEPMLDTANDITDTNKEIIWHYTVDQKTFLGLTQTHNFDRVYNDIIVLGNIVNGYQFKARVQNKNILSDTCVQKIGLKTKEPFEDNQYYSDEQCKELAIYYAKVDTILQKSGNIDSTSLYHFDVNKLVSVSTPNNNMSKELFLITGFSLNSSGTMSVGVTSVNILKDFSIVEVDINE